MNTATNKLHANESGSTTQKAASMAHEAIDHAAERAEPLEQKVRQQAHIAQDKFNATASQQLHQQVEKVETFIKERPVAATGIAFAAGILAAIILRR